jgi:hypothetical protein
MSGTRHEFAALLGDRWIAALAGAHLVSNLGDWLAFLALYELVALDRGAGPVATSLLGLAYVLPLALVGPAAGVVVDRSPPRRVLVASDLLRAMLVLGMAATRSLPALAVLLFAHQCVGRFFDPAQQAVLPRLAGGSRLLAANALVHGAGHAAKLAGPAVAGVLVAAFGARACFVADAASFALSGAALATLPALAPAAPRGGLAWSGLRADLRRGLAALWGTAAVRDAAARAAFVMMALGGYVAVLPVHARDRLGAGAAATGALLSVLGAGALAGALASPAVGRRFPAPDVMRCGSLVVAAGLAALAVARAPVVAGAGTFLVGLGAACVLVPAHAVLQRATPPALLGRVAASAVAAIGLLQAASMAVAGLVGARGSIPVWLTAASAALAATTVVEVVAHRSPARPASAADQPTATTNRS